MNEDINFMSLEPKRATSSHFGALCRKPILPTGR